MLSEDREAAVVFLSERTLTLQAASGGAAANGLLCDPGKGAARGADVLQEDLPLCDNSTLLRRHSSADGMIFLGFYF